MAIRTGKFKVTAQLLEFLLHLPKDCHITDIYQNIPRDILDNCFWVIIKSETNENLYETLEGAEIANVRLEHKKGNKYSKIVR